MVGAVAFLGFVVVAFAGGAIGAAIGGRQAYGLAGVLVVVGETITLVQRPPPAVAVDYTALGSSSVTASIGLGAGIGPHVAFAGGVAAAAYAARQEDAGTDFPYHEAKNIGRALGPRPKVLAVGGAFGVLGLLLARLSIALSLPWDPVAASVVLSAFLHRLAFGYPVVGDVRAALLDTSPYERGERRQPVSEAGAGNAPRRFVVEPWRPHQSPWASVALLGVVVGVFAGFVAHRTGSPFLAFGLTAATLLLGTAGLERFPVVHHMAFPAGVAVVSLAGTTAPAGIAAALSLPAALLVGAVFGFVSGLAAELGGRVLYAHADTHLDPPSVGIVAGTLLVGLLDVLGPVGLRIVPAPF